MKLPGILKHYLFRLKVSYWKLEQYLHLLKIRLAHTQSSIGKRTPCSGLYVTLTSYPPRFSTLQWNIKSLINQDMPPEKIILWVAENDKAHLPEEVIKLANNVPFFEVRTCEDLRSYKKIIPALLAYPEKHFVIADDDIIYPSNWLSSLYQSWSGNDKEVVAHRCHIVTFADNGTPKPYQQWAAHTSGKPEDARVPQYFPTGMGGVLYPSGSLNQTAIDQTQFLALCPFADDVWLFWMARLNGCVIKPTQTSLNFVALPRTDRGGLAERNVAQSGNDKQINAMIEKFGWPEY